jgi:hypothetical protein
MFTKLFSLALLAVAAMAAPIDATADTADHPAPGRYHNGPSRLYGAPLPGRLPGRLYGPSRLGYGYGLPPPPGAY